MNRDDGSPTACASPTSGRADGRDAPFVFISHCSEAKPALRPIVDALRANGIALWIDRPLEIGLKPEDLATIRRIRSGRRWEGEIYDAHRQAACVLVCWSRHGVDPKRDRRVFLREVDAALVNGTIVQCIVDDLTPAELPNGLDEIQVCRLASVDDPARRTDEIELLVGDVRERMRETVAYRAPALVQPPIPYSVNGRRPARKFSGRAGPLEEIHRYFLEQSDDADARIVAVCGMPGLGKSSLAAEYVRRFGDAPDNALYDGVLWFDAQYRGHLVEQIAAIGYAMVPAVDGTDKHEDEAAAKATLRRLDASRDSILYVFDNVETPRAIEALLPTSRLARVLITSQYPDWRKFGRQIDLPVFNEDEAARFLVGRTGVDDAVGAALVARDLGYLPLALEIAAAEIALGGNFATYRRKLARGLLRATPPGAPDEQNLHAVFQIALDRACGRSPHAETLLDYLAFCAAENIPPRLFEAALDDEDDCDEARMALAAVSLISRAPDGALSLHRLVQATSRAVARDNGRAAPAFARLVARLAELYAEDVTPENWAECAELTPHLLSVVELAGEAQLCEAADSVNLDWLGKLVVLAILYAPENAAGDHLVLAAPDYLVSVLSRFYEVEPLAGALEKLVAAKLNQWPELRDQLLERNNYVLRHALAQALAHVIQRGGLPIERAMELLESGTRLEAFEVGGYALGLLYANGEAEIDPVLLLRLADHPCYPGRSILGDLLLNLVFGNEARDLQALIPSAKFWKSHWDYISLDADAVVAAQAFMAVPPKDLPYGSSKGAIRDYAFFSLVETWRSDLQAKVSDPAIMRLLDTYRTLGVDPGQIRSAEDELRRSPHLGELMRLFFAHCQWSVAEAAATVLARIVGSAIVRKDRLPAAIITTLFDDEHWRVRFGAVEAAYALRHDDDHAAFTEAVKRFYADDNCKIRGLCAENLAARVLAAGAEEREGLIREFRTEIARWLRDEECWVLEHVHRFFSTLRGADSVEAEQLLSGPVSPLLQDMPEWPALPREEFLRGIEEAKGARR